MRIACSIASRMALVAVAALALLLAACGEDEPGGAPTDRAPDDVARALVQEYGELIVAGDLEGLRAFISDSLILVRADGSTATSENYLSNLPVVRSFTIDEVTARQEDDTLVVLWSITVDQDLEGETIVATGARRLSTFLWDAEAGRWRLAAHANFDALAEPIEPGAGGGN